MNTIRRRLFNNRRGDKHTKFLLHGYELNTLTDSSVYKVPLENVGATVNKDITRFGRGSLYFNGSSRIFLPYDTFLLGANKFTIDWWEYPTVGDKGTTFCTCYGTQSAFGGLLLCYKGTEIYASSAANTQWNIINAVEAKQLISNKWTHWAFVRGEGSIFVYKNGVRVKVVDMKSPYSIAQDSRFKMVIGDYRSDDHDCFTGYIEDFRISDTMRWTTNFIPPIKAHMGKTALKNYSPGDIVRMYVGGVLTEFVVLHQGNPDTSFYDTSCDGTWVRTKNAYTKMAWDSENNDYANSDINTWLNNDFINLLDADIRSKVVKQVKIPYKVGTGDASSSVNSGANGLSCKAFLLSMREAGKKIYGTIQDGVALDYYLGEWAEEIKFEGVKTFCFSRTPDKELNEAVYDLPSDTTGVTTSNVILPNGIAPTMILDPSVLVSSSGIISAN